MGLIDRRLRQHAHDIRVGADGLEHAASQHPDLTALASIADAGFDLAYRIEARLASAGKMNEWRRTAREAYVAWAGQYPGELAIYADTLADKKDAKLIRSMVPRSLR